MTLATRILTVTRGNVNNRHLYLTEVLDLFPEDALGGENRRSAAPRTVRVLWGDQAIDTDIVRDKHIFRRRKWVRLFFEANRIQDGDRVLLEQLGPYLYRVSPLSAEQPGYAALLGADSDKVAPPGEPLTDAPTCPTCGGVLGDAAGAILSRGLGGPHWLKVPVMLCGGCHSLLGQVPTSAAGRDLQARVEAAVSFWFPCPPELEP